MMTLPTLSLASSLPAVSATGLCTAPSTSMQPSFALTGEELRHITGGTRIPLSPSIFHTSGLRRHLVREQESQVVRDAIAYLPLLEEHDLSQQTKILQDLVVWAGSGLKRPISHAGMLQAFKGAFFDGQAELFSELGKAAESLDVSLLRAVRVPAPRETVARAVSHPKPSLRFTPDAANNLRVLRGQLARNYPNLASAATYSEALVAVLIAYREVSLAGSIPETRFFGFVATHVFGRPEKYFLGNSLSVAKLIIENWPLYAAHAREIANLEPSHGKRGTQNARLTYAREHLSRELNGRDEAVRCFSLIAPEIWKRRQELGLNDANKNPRGTL